MVYVGSGGGCWLRGVGSGSGCGSGGDRDIGSGVSGGVTSSGGGCGGIGSRSSGIGVLTVVLTV